MKILENRSRGPVSGVMTSWLRAYSPSPAFSAYGNHEGGVVHRRHRLVAERPDVGGGLHHGRRFVAVLPARRRAGQRGWVGRHQLRVHFVPEHDDALQPLGETDRRFREVPHVHPRLVGPALVVVGDAAQARPEELRDPLDLRRHRVRVVDGGPVRHHRRVVRNRRLEALPPALPDMAVRDQVGDQPRGVAKREVPLGETVAAACGEVRPVGGEEGVRLLRAHVLVPERTREDIVHLPERGEVPGRLDARLRVARGIPFPPARSAFFEAFLVAGPGHGGKVIAIRRRRAAFQPGPPATLTRGAARCRDPRRARRARSPRGARRGPRWRTSCPARRDAARRRRSRGFCPCSGRRRPRS